MTHERAIDIARAFAAAGVQAEITLAPAAPKAEECADVRIPLRIIGRRLTLGRLAEISQLLADHDAAGDVDGDFIRVIA